MNCIVDFKTAIGFKDVCCKTLVIPEGVTIIKNGAFRDYYGLEEVVFPSTLLEIGARAFENCTNLKYVSLPFEVNKLGMYAFAGCVNMKYADFLYTQIRIIPESTFLNCKSIEGIFLPDDVERICKNAFLSCDKLTYFYTPPKLKIFECIPTSKHINSIWIPNETIHIEDIEMYSFNNTEFILNQQQYERFRYVLPSSARITINNYYTNISKKVSDAELVLAQASDSINCMQNSLSVSENTVNYSLYNQAKYLLEIENCILNKPSKIEICKINFSNYNVDYDITTTITFNKKNRTYRYERTEFGNIQKTIGSGIIDSQEWENFENLCAKNTFLYKHSNPISSKDKRYWHIKLIYTNRKTIDYTSTNFKSEEYLLFYDCFGKYVET
ncbi:MAG: leucine-rich repeat domain-containing protein, partial [Candidatus Avispirillum sp.]